LIRSGIIIFINCTLYLECVDDIDIGIRSGRYAVFPASPRPPAILGVTSLAGLLSQGSPTKRVLGSVQACDEDGGNAQPK
jgi:hypothetical protein